MRRAISNAIRGGNDLMLPVFLTQCRFCTAMKRFSCGCALGLR